MLTEIDFKFLNDDLTFKYVFSHDYILKYFINLFLDYINSSLTFNIINVSPQAYLMPNNKTINLYYGDIVANLSNGDIISLEMYKNTFTIDDYNKSYAYKCRIFANQLKKVKNKKIDYKNMKKVISVNLIKGNFNKCNNKLVNCYRFKNDLLNIVARDNTIMYLVRFDLVDKMPYNVDEHKFITCLRLINSKDIEELMKYRNGGEIMQDIIDYVFEWNRESSKNGLERLIEDRSTEAEDKCLTKVAKKMIHKNMAIDDIMELTGLSKTEILDLENSNI